MEADRAAREQQILGLRPMVTSMAKKAQRRALSFEVDDLVSEGMIGAIQAVDRWDPEAGASLHTFARYRISGAIQDFIRTHAPLSRDHYARVQAGEQEFRLFSLDFTAADNGQDGPTTPLVEMLPDETDFFAGVLDEVTVAGLLDLLPKTQAELLQLYYLDGLTLAQIGVRHGVTESRICQKISRAKELAYDAYLLPPTKATKRSACPVATFVPNPVVDARTVYASMHRPLSERELDVLRLVALGVSNQEIADRLLLVPSTVRKYLRHVGLKLGVRGRWQAVAVAAERGLLSEPSQRAA